MVSNLLLVPNGWVNHLSDQMWYVDDVSCFKKVWEAKNDDYGLGIWIGLVLPSRKDT